MYMDGYMTVFVWILTPGVNAYNTAGPAGAQT